MERLAAEALDLVFLKSLLKGGQSARKGETEGIRCYG